MFLVLLVRCESGCLSPRVGGRGGDSGSFQAAIPWPVVCGKASFPPIFLAVVVQRANSYISRRDYRLVKGVVVVWEVCL